MRLFRLDDIRGSEALGEKDLLIREADDAFHADDRTRCVEVINRLYNLMDRNMGHARRPSVLNWH